MTGGRHRGLAENEVHHPYFPYRPPTPLPEQVEAERAIELWLAAASFRRRVNHALKPHDISFSQWRALYTVERLVRETGAMVSQLDVSRGCEMDENTVSAVMRQLVDKGWVSWGMDCFGFAYRLFATKKGNALLAATRGYVVAVANRIWGCARPIEPTSFAP